MIYLFLFIALLLAVGLLNSFRIETHRIKIEEPFKNKWANLLYRYSFHMPFIWFIDEEEKSNKTKELKTNLAKANLSHLFNYRSFTTLKVALLLGSIMIYLFFVLALNNADVLAQVLFNFQPKADELPSNNRNLYIIVAMVLLVCNLIPNLVLKYRVNVYEYYNIKDIPIIQMFIILMLRSKKPIGEVLFALSKINTRYKNIFDIGYRMYLRNKDEGLEYIKNSFGEEKFKETMNVLKDMGEYSREDSIKLLENNMQQLIEKNNATKRRSDLTNLVFSQSSLIIPFFAVIVLCLMPLVVYGIEVFESAGFGF